MLRRQRALVAAAVLAVILTAGWFVNNEASPLRPYFLHHAAWSNLLALVNMPAYLFGATVSGNIHAPSGWALWLGLLLQWLSLGYLFAVLAIRPSDVRPRRVGGAA